MLALVPRNVATHDVVLSAEAIRNSRNNNERCSGHGRNDGMGRGALRRARRPASIAAPVAPPLALHGAVRAHGGTRRAVLGFALARGGSPVARLQARFAATVRLRCGDPVVGS